MPKKNKPFMPKPKVWKETRRKNTSHLPSRLKDNVWRKPPKPDSTTDWEGLGMVTNDENLEVAYRTIEKLINKLCVDDGHTPLEVAGVMMAQAMRIYKTALGEEEFNRMVETILETRKDVTPFQKPTIN